MENNTHNEEVKQQGLAIVDNLLNKPSKVTVALIRDAVLSGDSDPAYVGIVLKKFAKIAETVKKDKDVQDIIETETKKYQEGTVKTFNLHGAKVTIANTGFWDYSQTEDEYLNRLQEIETTVKTLIKNRKEAIQLQVAEYEVKNSPKNIVDFGLKPFTITWNELPELTFIEGYGESNTNPPIKKGKETLRYTL